MDIHKPKPWAGWREFVKEIGTIVIGVLIALGAEQAVEWLHWQQRTHEAEQSMRGELSRATVYAQIHITVEACELDMLQKVRATLLAPGDGWRPPYVIRDTQGADHGLLEVPINPWSGESWRNAQADGTVNHLSAGTQARYSADFTKLAATRANNEVENALAAELGSLTAPRRLDSQSRTDYLRLIAREQESVREMALLSRQVLRDAGKLGMKPVSLRGGAFAALKFHQSVCDQFHAGNSAIVVDVGPDAT
jgi:hypothetical protein